MDQLFSPERWLAVWNTAYAWLLTNVLVLDNAVQVAIIGLSLLLAMLVAKRLRLWLARYRDHRHLGRGVVIAESVAMPLIWLALLWIAASMLNEDDEEAHLDAHSHLWSAIRVIIVADFIMSLDNVIGVAAAAKGNIVLLILGLGISIPLIIWGSQIVLKLMRRFPIIITAGAALLGWVAGEMLVSDEAVAPFGKVHRKLARGIGEAVVGGRHHVDHGRHVRMDVAVDVHDPGSVELLRLSGALPVEPEVEGVARRE